MSTEPVVPRPAATVILLRDAPLQVFLLRRVAGMAFAGGMTVFPGGGVDARDRVDGEPWAGPAPEWWGERFSCPAADASALVRAAVRETFEESGVRLTADLLQPWARWITPTGSPRRYDTAFFVTGLPDGQETDARTTEAVEAAWWAPAEALACYADGDMLLMTPTFHMLQEISGHPDTASVLAAAREREIRPVTPQVRRENGRTVVVLPDAPDVPLGGTPAAAELGTP